MAKNKFNFFNQVFQKKKKDNFHIQFGKFSDRNKTTEQLKYWKESLDLYSQKDYLRSAEKFFLFIKEDKYDNVNFEIKNKKIEFNFYQGSKQIKGLIDNEKIIASAEIIILNNKNFELEKAILETNYNLKFCKFSINKKRVFCELYLYTKNTNPISLYYALREIAIISDQYDDILMIDFNNVSPINISHITPLTEEELNTKIIFFRKWTSDLFNNIKKYEVSKYSGARAFLMLGYLYKIMYLLNPEGELLENLKKIINFYYSSSTEVEIEKNAKMYEKILKISELSDEELKNSFYFVYSTFPDVPPTEPFEVISFLKQEVDKIHWYEDKNHNDIVLAITDYAVGYACYHFGNEPLINELFEIYWEVMYSDFYKALKIKNIPVEKNRISFFVFTNRINSVNMVAKNLYPNFLFNIKHINIANFSQFAQSFIYEILNLNFKQKKEK